MEIRTPHEIVEELAATPHPDVARDPDESLAVLGRLIDEARLSVRASRGRRPARTYSHEDPSFSRAMKLIDDAPVSDLRAFARDTVDVLWGEGSAALKHDARRIDVDKEWEVETIEEVAFALSHCTFHPCPEGRA